MSTPFLQFVCKLTNSHRIAPCVACVHAWLSELLHFPRVPAALPHPEDLDWTQPLRAASSSAKAAATAAVAAGRAGPGRAPGVSRPAAVSLVLGLLDDLLRVGMYDVARHLAKALLHQAVHLGGDHLRALAGVLSQVGRFPNISGQGLPHSGCIWAGRPCCRSWADPHPHNPYVKRTPHY